MAANLLGNESAHGHILPTLKMHSILGAPMESGSKFHDSDARRYHDRKKYEKEIVFVHADRLYAGSMKNISLGGAYIETYCVNQFCPRDIVTISIPFSSGNKNIKRRGRVKWLNNVGFAIEFI